MKAGIITHYNVHNHGAHLQLYALCKQLNKMGYEVHALQFRKNFDFLGGEQANAKYNPSMRSIPIYVRYLLSNGVERTFFNYKKRKILKEFRDSAELVGMFYSEAKDLDIVVIGSDEIFSIEAGPNPWYYGFGIPCRNQVSYAASFGPTTLECLYQHNMDSMVAAGINHLNAVSVRDENSQSIVRKLTGINAAIVCDPVLLYGFQEEMDRFKPSETDYMVVYSYDNRMNDSIQAEKILQFARKKGCKVYSVGFYHKWCDKNINADPFELLGWIKNSRFVVTDTFHGAVLSMLCNTPMAVKFAGNQNKLQYLLEEYDLMSRNILDYEELEHIYSTEIDFDRLNENIMKRQSDSLKYLASALEGQKENDCFSFL